MKRFQLTLAAAIMAVGSVFAQQNEFTGSFACKAKDAGKNSYLMDSCRVDFTIKRVVGAPGYIAKPVWTAKDGYKVNGSAVKGADIQNFKNMALRYNNIAPTKATFNFTVLFYSEKFNCYIASAKSSMVVDNLERAGATNSPEILKVGSWREMFTDVVIGKQDPKKVGVVVADAKLDTWMATEGMTKGKLDMSVRGSGRSLIRAYGNATRLEIVNPSMNVEWDVKEYDHVSDGVKAVNDMMKAFSTGDSTKAFESYYIGRSTNPVVLTTSPNFWQTTIVPYDNVNKAYKDAEEAYKKGDFETAKVNYQKVLELDPSMLYCSHRIAKINEVADMKKVRNLGGIEMVYVKGNSQIKSFYVAKTEVTNSQWRRVMNNGSTANTMDAETRLKPVSNITWDEAVAFVKELNEQSGLRYRLLTQKEWEYAAKGGENAASTEFSGSDNINDVAWTIYNAEDDVHQVAQKEPNALGIYDMTGNVAEWIAEKFDKNTRLVKGGSYADPASACSIKATQQINLKVKNKTIGLRLALDE